MSVVVYHDGVMAADSRAYSGSTHPAGHKRKIHRLPDGGLVGITSNQIGMPEAFRDWLAAGANREASMPNEPGFDALHVTSDGEVFLYSDSYTPSGPLYGTTFTIGSGKAYALGALKAGASVTEAIEIAKECDLWCGGPVIELPLYEDTKP
ncbi:peptidase HslV family [Rhizobium phage RHEph10]|uniref:peptidase HslV family n=1 Tax=Rhizobium phage RHEph10 TaxID=1220717 RepID=UPI0002AB6982|nr:peptidase HslV family [Rhizobium phage RHEph10]AGC36195.1 putative peptidase protein [Rhizobium phage RHEph10]